MSGDPDLYVRARNALLDAAEALAEQLDAVVLVGAQAVYLHTGDADFPTAPYTTDADFCVTPADLNDTPRLADLLIPAGFSLEEQPGAWHSQDGIRVDLMVPEELAGAGSRGARLGPHGDRVARRAKGLEGALVDRKPTKITSLTPGVERSVTMLVAGPAALLVSKVHKVDERTGAGARISDKDALDILRLLQATDTGPLAEDLVSLTAHEGSADVAAEAVSQLMPLFGSSDAPGIEMAVRAAGPTVEPDEVRASFTALISDLVAETNRLRSIRPLPYQSAAIRRMST